MHILEIIGKSYEKALTSCCSYDMILITLPVSAFRKKEEKEWKKVLDISWRTRYNNYRSLEKIEGAFAGD